MSCPNSEADSLGKDHQYLQQEKFVDATVALPNTPVSTFSTSSGGLREDTKEKSATGPQEAPDCSSHAEITCVQFVSPNTDELMTLDQAQACLRSPRRLTAKQSADLLDKELGLKSRSDDAIGHCPDGVENSIVTVSIATDRE